MNRRYRDTISGQNGAVRVAYFQEARFLPSQIICLPGVLAGLEQGSCSEQRMIEGPIGGESGRDRDRSEDLKNDKGPEGACTRRSQTGGA